MMRFNTLSAFYLVALHFFISLNFAFAQTKDSYLLKTLPKNEQKAVNKAKDLHRLGKYEASVQKLNPLLAKYQNVPYIQFLQALNLSALNNADNISRSTELFAQAAANKNFDVPASVNYHLGLQYHCSALYQKASEAYVRYLSDTGSKLKEQIADAELRLIQCRNAISNKNFKVNEGVVAANLGAGINTSGNEYAPLPDGSDTLIYYTCLRANATGGKEEFVMKASLNNLGVSSVKHLEIPANSSNVSAVGLSADGKQMLLYVSDDAGNGDLFIWHPDSLDIAPKILHQKINTEHNEGSACINKEGDMIIYSAEQPWGYGGRDLYMMVKDKNGNWRNPVNLGRSINTPYNDDAPSLSADNNVLFFHSQGHNSIGGTDIFRAVKVGDLWSAPVNLGSPYNTPFNDGYFNASLNSKKAYFASDRAGGFGDEDIYEITPPVDSDVLPQQLLMINALTAKAANEFKLALFEKGGNSVDLIGEDALGKSRYFAVLEPLKTYQLLVQQPGFRDRVLEFSTTAQKVFSTMSVALQSNEIVQFGIPVGEVSNIEINKGSLDKNAALDSTHFDRFVLLTDYLSQTNPQFKKNLADQILNSQANVLPNCLIESYVDEYYYDENDHTIAKLPNKLSGVVYQASAEPNERLVKIAEVPRQPVKPNETGAKPTDNKLLPTKPVSAKEMFTDSASYNIYFETAKFDVSAEYEKIVSQMAQYAKGMNYLKIDVKGYTDAMGTAEKNQLLSNQRANAVVELLLAQGFKRKQIIASPMGVAPGADRVSAEARKVMITLKGQR